MTAGLTRRSDFIAAYQEMCLDLLMSPVDAWTKLG